MGGAAIGLGGSQVKQGFITGPFVNQIFDCIRETGEGLALIQKGGSSRQCEGYIATPWINKHVIGNILCYSDFKVNMFNVMVTGLLCLSMLPVASSCSLSALKSFMRIYRRVGAGGLLNNF